MAASRVRMSVEQSLTFKSSEIAIEGATVRNGPKLDFAILIWPSRAHHIWPTFTR
jgi:hypothetical protein